MSSIFNNRGYATVLTLVLGVVYLGSIGLYSAHRALTDPDGQAALKAYQVAHAPEATRLRASGLLLDLGSLDCPESPSRTAL